MRRSRRRRGRDADSPRRHVARPRYQFEDLGASATLYTSDAFERYGFAEVEAPDLTALGRGEPIVTHEARLPAAIIALDRAAAASPRAAALATALRSQPPPERRAARREPEKLDPWAGVSKML